MTAEPGGSARSGRRRRCRSTLPSAPAAVVYCQLRDAVAVGAQRLRRVAPASCRRCRAPRPRPTASCVTVRTLRLLPGGRVLCDDRAVVRCSAARSGRVSAKPAAVKRLPSGIVVVTDDVGQRSTIGPPAGGVATRSAVPLLTTTRTIALRSTFVPAADRLRARSCRPARPATRLRRVERDPQTVALPRAAPRPDMPTKFGTTTGGGPFETISVTRLPSGTFAPGFGSWSMTLSLHRVVEAPRERDGETLLLQRALRVVDADSRARRRARAAASRC